MNIDAHITQIDKIEEDLRKIRSDSSLMEDYGKVRSETAHTQFLASLFKKIGEPGVKNLLKIILSKDEKLKEKYEELKSIDNIDIQDLNVTPEFPIETKNYGKGNVDIVIQGKIQDKSNSINIIIENKIDAAETVKKNKKDKENLEYNNSNREGLRYQTDAYYKYFTNDQSQFKNNINIFVYLKAVSTSDLQNMKPGEIEKGSCKNENYVLLNYQRLYEEVILPYKSNLKRNSRDEFKIKDYIRALGLPTDYENKVYKTPIMAYSEPEKDLLKKLVSNHSTILSEAFSVMADDATDDPGLCELYTTIADSLKSSKKYRTTYSASIDDNLVTGTMWEIVRDFAIMLLEEKEVSEINKIIQNLRTIGDPTTSLCFAESDFPDEKFGIYSNSNKPRAKSFSYKAKTYWLTDQWGASGANPTFDNFIKNVKEKYDIVITAKEE